LLWLLVNITTTKNVLVVYLQRKTESVVGVVAVAYLQRKKIFRKHFLDLHLDLHNKTIQKPTKKTGPVMQDVGVVGTVETSFIRNRRGTPDPKQRSASSVPSLSLSLSLSPSAVLNLIQQFLRQFLVSLSLASDNFSDKSILCFHFQAMAAMICGVCGQPSLYCGRAERKTTSFTVVVVDGFQDSVVCS
jgi:hypothetical protein